MKPFTQRNKVTMAVVGLGSLFAILAVTFNLDKLPVIGSGPVYHAVFADASGLQPGEEVRVAGIKVGDVTEIDLADTGVVVGFHVKGTTLGDATRASIEIKTLLGQYYLSIDPAGGGKLPVGSTIPLSRTSVPLNLVPAFQQLTNQVDQIDTGQVAKAFDTLTDAMNGTAPEVKDTLTGLTALSHTIATRDGQLQQLFAHADDVTGTLAAQGKQITQLMDASNQVLAVVHARRDTIHQLLVGTTQLSDQLTGLVNDNRAQLGPTLDKLHDVVRVLRADDAQLNQILSALPTYVTEFTNVVGSGHWFDSVVTVPRGMALCDTNQGGNGIDGLLSSQNRAVNGSNAPCLPLGVAPNAADSTPPGGSR